MKRFTICAVILALGTTTLAPLPANALGDNEKAALAAILALGIGIAAAKHGANHDGNTQWDEDRYGKPFQPAAGVVCLPKPRKCYKDGHLSWRWTQRIFG